MHYFNQLVTFDNEENQEALMERVRLIDCYCAGLRDL